jgi:hypothetical protein
MSSLVRPALMLLRKLRQPLVILNLAFDPVCLVAGFN